MASAPTPASISWVFRVPQKATAAAVFSQGRLVSGAANPQAVAALKYHISCTLAHNRAISDARAAAVQSLSPTATMDTVCQSVTRI